MPSWPQRTSSASGAPPGGAGRDGTASLQQGCGVSWPGVWTEGGRWGHGGLWGVSPSPGWGRWVEEVSAGAQVGGPGMSPSLAMGRRCLLQRGASDTYSQGPDGPLSFQGLRRFGSKRRLLRIEGRQAP